MIIRVVRFRVASAFAHAAREAGRAEFFGPNPPPGLVRALFGRQESGGDWVTFATVTEWADMGSLYAWVGGADLHVVALPDGWTAPTELLDVQHYLSEGLDPAPDAPETIAGAGSVHAPVTG